VPDRVLLVDVVQVVGRDEREVEVLRQVEQIVADPLLDREAVLHQLAEVVLRTEDVAQFRRGGDRIRVLAQPQVGLDLTGGTARGGDQALAVGVEQFAVDARLVEEALEAGLGAELEQVVHALGGLREQRHVGERATAGDVVAAAVAPLDAAAFEPRSLGRDVGLEPDDRLDPVGLGLLVELVGPVEIAVIGDRHRRHLHLRTAGHQVGDSGRTVEHRILRMHVQVDERVLGISRPAL